MNATPSVQDLWSQILALPAGDRHWLQDKLNVYEEEEEGRTCMRKRRKASRPTPWRN